MDLQVKKIYTGIGLAVLATFIWSGNFIVARLVYNDIPPIALNFYRWLCASLVILPFVFLYLKKDWKQLVASWPFLFLAALAGVALFNTFVYVGAHYTTAINLALIGTTSSPVMSVVFANIFLKEKISWQKITGLIICIVGILFLLSKGHFKNLTALQFGTGDLWILLAAFCFAVYNTLVKKKPAAISSISFLTSIFMLGTIMVFPFYIYETNQYPPIHWNGKLILSVLFLGIGASVICFFIWNKAIRILGAGRTALFGNLIPVFSSIEAVLWLNEKITLFHLVSFILVVAGLLIANFKK